MGAEGFDYAPREHGHPEAVAADWATDPLLLPLLPDDRDGVAAVGYGVDDVEAQEAELEATETPDRSSEYLATLGPSTQSAHVKALTGADGPDGESAAADGGCAGPAQAEHPAPADDRPDVSDLVRSVRDVVQDDVFQEPEALALADLDCRERTDYAARLTDVVEALQRAFVATHADELARLTSAAAVS